MANTDTPFGLRPIRKIGSAYVTGGGNVYHVAAGDAQVIAPGDPVVVTGEADADGIPTVTRVAGGDGNDITGVMISIANGNPQLDGTGSIDRDSSLNTIPSTSQYILVEDDPNTIFEAQMSGALATGDIQSTANVLAGTAIEGRSGFEIDSTSIGVDAAHQVKIMRLVPRANNEVGDNAKVEVMINLPTNTAGFAGV